jgi:arsenate reductase
MTKPAPLRVLFLCTGNSARSQIAEALLQQRGRGRFSAASAGTQPADRINAYALDVLGRHGIYKPGARPKNIDEMIDEPWDLVITVCDNARETCPFIPGTAARSHWGMSDPAQVTGPENARRAFQNTFDTLRRRIDMLISLPVHLLTREALAQRVTEIAHLVPEQPDIKGAAGVG